MHIIGRFRWPPGRARLARIR